MEQNHQREQLHRERKNECTVNKEMDNEADCVAEEEDNQANFMGIPSNEEEQAYFQQFIEAKVEDARNAPPLYKQFLLFLIILIPPHHVRKSQICLVGVKVYDCSYTWYKQFSVILNFEGEIKEKSYIL